MRTKQEVTEAYQAFILRMNLKSNLEFHYQNIAPDIEDLQLAKSVGKVIRQLGWTSLGKDGKRYFIPQADHISAGERVHNAINNSAKQAYLMKKNRNGMAQKSDALFPEQPSKIDEIHSMLTRISEKLML